MTYMIGRGPVLECHDEPSSNTGNPMNSARAWAGGAPTSQPLYKEVKSRITKSLIAGECSRAPRFRANRSFRRNFTYQ